MFLLGSSKSKHLERMLPREVTDDRDYMHLSARISQPDGEGVTLSG